MPVVVITTFDATREQYDAVNAKLNAESDPPQGGLVHTGGQLSDGRMRVIDVWESESDWESFRENRLGPAVQEVGGDLAPAPDIEVYELHDFQVAPNAGG
jgi:hypothetical protein